MCVCVFIQIHEYEINPWLIAGDNVLNADSEEKSQATETNTFIHSRITYLAPSLSQIVLGPKK